MTRTSHSHSRIAALASLGAALFLAITPAHAGIGADEGDPAPAVVTDSGCAGPDGVFVSLPAEEPSADDALAAQQAAAAQGTEVTADERNAGKAG